VVAVDRVTVRDDLGLLARPSSLQAHVRARDGRVRYGFTQEPPIGGPTGRRAFFDPRKRPRRMTLSVVDTTTEDVTGAVGRLRGPDRVRSNLASQHPTPRCIPAYCTEVVLAGQLKEQVGSRI